MDSGGVSAGGGSVPQGFANGLYPEWPPPRQSLMPDGRITAPGYVFVAPGERAAQIVPVPMSQLAPQQAAQLAERDATARQTQHDARLPAVHLPRLPGTAPLLPPPRGQRPGHASHQPTEGPHARG